MALIKNYGFISELGTEEFEFSFSIPNNCNFTTSYDASKDIHTVSVQLNSGQSQPSGTYVDQNCTFNSAAGLLNVYFQETYNSVTTRRPKVTINENDC
ncbi:hypothetical protein [Flavobacterium sp.]|uniref:hypothetical protein n=1 Tax=Flavobacterium sp. TaxID=239 RepID=UPI0028BE3629|nr:hypothetical protein [Flavobacterium sp.]